VDAAYWEAFNPQRALSDILCSDNSLNSEPYNSKQGADVEAAYWEAFNPHRALSETSS